jgi:hypothetical protein
MTIEAMKQALEALENLQGLCSEESGFVEQVTIWTPDAIYALRTAIAEAEKQEPVAWAMDYDIESVLSGFSTSLIGTAMRIESAFPKHRVKLLYTTPPAATPVQEPVAWMNKHGACKTSLFREVEAGAKDEYTIPLYTTPPAQPAQQEPVAKVRVHMTGGNAGLTWSATAVNAYDSLPPLADGTLLYTTPPAAQRQWVGLTDEDCKGMNVGDMVVAMWADRVLKEKNT